MTAINPKEALKENKTKEHHIPESVLRVVNTFIVERYHYKGANFTINMAELKAALLEEFQHEHPEMSFQQMCDNKWLDFEPHYRNQGWDVHFDKGAYYEEQSASVYRFTPQEES